MLRKPVLIGATAVLLGLVLVCGGCSEPTVPLGPGANTGRVGAEGNIDPNAATFVLKTIDLPPPWDGPPLQIQLVGSNLLTGDADETISLDVAIRNLSGRPLYAPGVVWIEGFTPPTVTVTNPDLTLIPPAISPVDTFAYWVRYGFDYAELLGADGVLDHEELSETKTWIFHDPGLVSFSFQGWAEFSPEPDRPRIAGYCFVDLDADGQPGANEPPLQGAIVDISLPDGDIMSVVPGLDGHYSFPVENTGLYQLRAGIIFGLPPYPPWTTPNPREVLLTPGPNGEPNSFLEAHFGRAGWYPPGEPEIMFTDLPPDSLHRAPWTFIDGFIDGGLLRLHVGFSGCQPEHPFSLWMSGGFMESNPVRVSIVPVNELEEDCDAWFETEVFFNLWPLRERFLEAYGPGELILMFVAPNGQRHELRWGIYPPD
jgi:hypothetical protein